MLIVALVDKYYDIVEMCDKLRARYPDIDSQPIYIAGKSESHEKIKRIISKNQIIVYDKDSCFDYLRYLNPYLKKNNKTIINLAEGSK